MKSKDEPNWVVKYNGFNNGKDASDGVGGKKIPLFSHLIKEGKDDEWFIEIVKQHIADIADFYLSVKNRTPNKYQKEYKEGDEIHFRWTDKRGNKMYHLFTKVCLTTETNDKKHE